MQSNKRDIIAFAIAGFIAISAGILESNAQSIVNFLVY